MAKVAGKKNKANDAGKLGRKDYENELKKLHVELVKLQQWVVEKGLKVCIIFEGRDGAGKAAPSRPSPSASAPGCSAWWRCRRRPNARRPRSTPSATSPICRPPVKW
jgi:hypothetical protein